MYDNDEFYDGEDFEDHDGYWDDDFDTDEYVGYPVYIPKAQWWLRIRLWWQQLLERFHRRSTPNDMSDIPF